MLDRTTPRREKSLLRAARLEALAPGIAGFQIVPELDVFLILFPTEKNLFAGNEGGKINQAAVEVFDLDFALLKFEQRLLDVSECADPIVGEVATDIASAGLQLRQPLVAFLHALARASELLEPGADLRQECPCLV